MRVIAAFLILATSGCGNALAPWGADGQSYPRAETLAVAESGKPIVLAVYSFHHHTGLWPSNLDELIAADLHPAQAGGWRYRTWHNGDWSLVYANGFPGGTVRYSHPTNRKAQWEVWWGDPEGPHGIDPLPVGQPVPTESALPAGKLELNRLAAIERRIDRKPDHLIHHKGLISLLYYMGRYVDARDACQRCLDQWPDHWWPNLMIGLIDIKCGDAAGSERRLRQWADRHGDFHHRYFLAHFYLSGGRVEQARQALRQAVDRPVNAKWDRHGYEQTKETSVWGDETYLHDAAIIAYRLGDLELCLAVCARWEEFIRARGYGDPGYTVLRAACRLNQGKFDEAEQHLRDTAAGPRYGSCIGDHVERLRKAILAKATTHRYDPEASGDHKHGVPLNLLIDYR